MQDFFFLIVGIAVGAVPTWFAMKGRIRHAEALENERAQWQIKAEGAINNLQASREQIIRLEVEKDSSQEKIQQQKSDLERIGERFRAEFENLANRIFEEKTEKFKETSKGELDQLLSPLKGKLDNFQKKIDESFGAQAKEQYSLRKEIERIVTINEKMTFETEGLSKALRGDTKAQGDWGEVMLNKILEESELRKGKDYIVQGEGLDLRHVETGKAIRPDVIVMLPEDKHIIIDSKVSLTHYDAYCNTKDETEKEKYLQSYLSSIRNHVDGLERRRYQDTEKLGTPDFVLMFMRIEGAYSLAVQHDEKLHNYAWDKKVVIVCPSTLFATLRTIACVWKLELQNQNALEIARRGGALYDKVCGFIDDMLRLRKQLDGAKNCYDEAMGKLSEGRGNILRRAEDLKILGAKASKKLPVELISPAGTGEDAEVIDIKEGSANKGAA